MTKVGRPGYLDGAGALCPLGREERPVLEKAVPGVVGGAALRNRMKSGGSRAQEALGSSVSTASFCKQGQHDDSYALLGELAPCGSTDKQTCLKTVLLLTDNKKNVSAPPLSFPACLGPACKHSRLYATVAFLAGGGLQIRWQCVTQ